jgi:hypothetical protein
MLEMQSEVITRADMRDTDNMGEDGCDVERADERTSGSLPLAPGSTLRRRIPRLLAVQ